MLTFAHSTRRRVQASPAATLVPPNARPFGQPEPIHSPFHAARRKASAARRSRFYGFTALACALGSFSSLPACTCSRDDHHPYTPFGMASSGANTTVAPPPSAELPPPTFKPLTSTAVNPPSPTFTGSGLNLQAPPGLAFARALDAKLGPDTHRVLLAWLVPTDTSAVAGSGLWAFDEAANPRELTKLPGFVPTGPDCRSRVDLQQTGPATVTLDVGSECKKAGIPRAPTRALLVLEPLALGRQLVQLRFAEPAANERLSLSVNTTDRDADGHDDVQLDISVSRVNSHEPATGSLLWLDRTAGAARDFAQPARGMTEQAKVDRGRADSAKGASGALERVENARRWFAFVCAEGHSYRVTDADGKPLPCGNLLNWSELLVQAEVRAAVTSQDWARALFALDRADWTLAKPSAKALEEASLALLKALPPKKSRFERLDISALGAGNEPRMSPLTFNPKGELFVQTRDGVVSVTSTGSAQPSDALDPWPLVVLGPGERRLTGLGLPCDRSDVTLQARDPEGRFYDALSTSLFAPRPGACGGSGHFFEPEVRAVGWTELEPDVLIGPLRQGQRLALGTPGGPVSPDGKTSVAVTGQGLLIQSTGQSTLWQLPAPIELAECVINDGATSVACLEGTRVVRLRAL